MKKKYRLKKNEDIAKVVRARKSVGNRYYAIYYLPNNLNKPQIAVSISRKFGNAVERNYEKRVVRSIVRQRLKTLTSYSYLIVIKRAVKRLRFQEKQKQINYLLDKIN